MTKDEYRFFIEALSDLGDDWTEEQISESSFADMPLQEAIDARTAEVNEFTLSLATAVNHILND